MAPEPPKQRNAIGEYHTGKFRIRKRWFFFIVEELVEGNDGSASWRSIPSWKEVNINQPPPELP